MATHAPLGFALAEFMPVHSSKTLRSVNIPELPLSTSRLTVVSPPQPPEPRRRQHYRLS